MSSVTMLCFTRRECWKFFAAVAPCFLYSRQNRWIVFLSPILSFSSSTIDSNAFRANPEVERRKPLSALSWMTTRVNFPTSFLRTPFPQRQCFTSTSNLRSPTVTVQHHSTRSFPPSFASQRHSASKPNFLIQLAVHARVAAIQCHRGHRPKDQPASPSRGQVPT